MAAPISMTKAERQLRDVDIMNTNNSSIVSKRSVEKLYYAGEPDYFRYFVHKFKRRSPLINRGYWLRMRAIEHTVEQFLKEPTDKKKLVINLGCGYDPLPWLFLGKRKEMCSNAKFIDVDYTELMHKKVEVIKKTPQFSDLLPDLTYTVSNDGVLCDSNQYAAIAANLRNLDFLRFVLKERMSAETSSVAILFVAEVSIAYMEMVDSQAVIEWAASYDNARFCLLEQYLPDGKDHPFAQTMLKHFEKLRTPLHAIGTMDDMRKRFAAAGWPERGIDIQSLWQLWSDLTFMTDRERNMLDDVEPFDEWEEFALFASHYFLLVAYNDRIVNTSRDTGTGLPLDTPMHCEIVSQNFSHRRFGAIIPGRAFYDDKRLVSDVGLYGGMGNQERLTDTATYTTRIVDASRQIQGPPLREGLMCHTISYLDGKDECLLVGGRTTPLKASAACWLKNAAGWRRVHDLPEGRYRHCAQAIEHESQLYVLVFGGKTSSGRVLSSFLLWNEATGWRKIQSSRNITPRFGAVLSRSSIDAPVGYILGGISEHGRLCDEALHWSLHINAGAMLLEVTQNTYLNHLCRFGAQTMFFRRAPCDLVPLLVGGIGRDGVITRDQEICNVRSKRAYPLKGDRPLLVGMSIQSHTSFGGGATCFSFGTFWSPVYIFRVDAVPDHDSSQTFEPWQLCSSTSEQDLAHTAADLDPFDNKNPSHVPIKIEVIQMPLTEARAFEKLLDAGKPVILRGGSIGPCVDHWTPDYLKAAMGERKVVVHSSNSQQMDFQKKNFQYEVKNFGSFVDEVDDGGLLYMRALSTIQPSENVTDLTLDFPEIANDFILPAELAYVTANAHSSPLRISGPVNMWLHYDVMANVLCQIRGRKRLLLYPPSDVKHLGLEAGMSSSSLNVFEENAETHTTLKYCHPQEAQLEPGDILLIPSLWLHAAVPTDGMSVAVNVFFRDLQNGYAAGRDVYGNRDLAAYERGRKDIARIAKSFAELPADRSQFYTERLIAELRSLTKT